MDINLSKEADALICILYKSYCQKRKDNISKSDAKILGSSEEVHNTLLPKWNYKDLDDTFRELHGAELLECFYADDVVFESCLTNNAITYMENRFKNGLNEVLDYLQKIRSILFGG